MGSGMAINQAVADIDDVVVDPLMLPPPLPFQS